MSTIIVAGGSGYIGQEVIRAAVGTQDDCLSGGHNVINIDLRPPRPVPERLREAGAHHDVNADPRVTLIQADLSDREQVATAVDAAVARAGEVAALCNLVGLVRYGASDGQLAGPNVRSVENLARECADRDILLMQLSGTAVHGSSLRGKVRETDPVRPVEAYGRSKAAAERLIFEVVRSRGLRAIVFRATNPIGPELQLSELNKLYETVMNDPIVPAVRGSRATYVSTIDVGRAFVYAAENAGTVVSKAPANPSDIVFNLGVRESSSDVQTVAHLIRTTKPQSRKPIVALPPAVVVAAAYLMTAWTKADNRIRRRTRQPVLHYDLARLFRGSHDQDQTKFIRVFEDNGFTFKHPTTEEVLDVGTVYKFLTDWADRPQPPRIEALVRQYLAER